MMGGEYSDDDDATTVHGGEEDGDEELLPLESEDLIHQDQVT